MAIRIKAHHNGDDVFVLWRPDGPTPACRGFAVEKRTKSKGVEVLPTWMGFEKTKWKKGTKKLSTVWPVQKFTWVDYSTRDGDTVQYRVVPMVGKVGLSSGETTWRAAGRRGST